MKKQFAVAVVLAIIIFASGCAFDAHVTATAGKAQVKSQAQRKVETCRAARD